MTKLFIATPAFDGKVNVAYAISMAETRLLMAMNQIDVVIRVKASGSLLVRERNDLIKDFLKTDCTHMLCVDSDIAWNPIDVKRMIEHDEPFVAALYPARGPDNVFLFRAVTEGEDNRIAVSPKGLLKMEYIPAGFMLLKRDLLEKMIAHFPELYYCPKDENLKYEAGHYLFAVELWEGEFWGEDYTFCRRARQAGFDIWIDPVVRLDHQGKIAAMADILSLTPDSKVASTLTPKEDSNGTVHA